MWKELVCYCGSLGIHNLEIINKTHKNKGFKCHWCSKTIQLRNGQSFYNYVALHLIKENMLTLSL